MDKALPIWHRDKWFYNEGWLCSGVSLSIAAAQLSDWNTPCCCCCLWTICIIFCQLFHYDNYGAVWQGGSGIHSIQGWVISIALLFCLFCTFFKKRETKLYNVGLFFFFCFIVLQWITIGGWSRRTSSGSPPSSTYVNMFRVFDNRRVIYYWLRVEGWGLRVDVYLPRKLLFLCQFPAAWGSPGQTARLFFTEEYSAPLLSPRVGPTHHCLSLGSQNRKVGVEEGVLGGRCIV